MGWSEDVWDFAPLKEGKTPILRNNDSNMTTMLQTKEIASAADPERILKNDLSGVYVLTTDIDISESASGTAVIPGIFKGTLKWKRPSDHRSEDSVVRYVRWSDD